jgi:hypothetical protein
MPSCDATGRSVASAHHQDANLPVVNSPKTDTAKVSNIQAMNQQIAAAAEQQGAVAEEISRSVVNVRDISGQTATASDETAASSWLAWAANCRQWSAASACRRCVAQQAEATQPIGPLTPVLTARGEFPCSAQRR